ncbi:MAG: phosphoribosylamine--glycine ligase [Kiritimatiellia bacterium]|jgi:phosphoribosylamine--glycine ligase
MKILVIGSGGREHAIAWRLAQDDPASEIFCAPGNAGTAALGTNLPIAATDLDGLAGWAREHRPGLTVVGPEAPLCAGLADRFSALGLAAFGPCRAAARLEGSKSFCKDVLCAAGVPTARAEAFTSLDAALAGLDRFSLPVVVKADGLAAGKGVIPCFRREEAETALRDILDGHAFGAAGATVLVEEFLEGEEASILALVDGKDFVLLPSSQDHKRVFDGDEGPNTGGMGAYSPAPVVTPELEERVRREILAPTLAELARRGIPYKGVLYAGLMITADGPKVLEYNCRFGDPETEAVLPRLAVPLLPLLKACCDGTLLQAPFAIRPEPCVTVVMASEGYPGPYPAGLPISGLADAEEEPGVIVFHAGTALEDGRVVTAGGRVLGVTALAPGLQEAVAKAYRACAKIHFDGAHRRSDIARRALARLA